jgi:hypothetical protein
VYRKLLPILALLLISFIILKAFQTFPFRQDPRASSAPDQAFFDPEKDHFFDLETN